MIAILKACVLTVYLFAMMGGGPCLIVLTAVQLQRWLGDSIWSGLAIAPVVLVEFVALLLLMLWDDNPIPRWLSSDN